MEDGDEEEEEGDDEDALETVLQDVEDVEETIRGWAWMEDEEEEEEEEEEGSVRASRGGRAERDDEEEEEEGGEEREDEEEESWDALDRRFEALRRGRPGVRARSEEEGEVEGTPAQRPRLEAEVEEREEEVSAGASLVLTGFSISAGTSRLVRLQSFGTPDGALHDRSCLQAGWRWTGDHQYSHHNDHHDFKG